MVESVAFAAEHLAGDPQLENLLTQRQQVGMITSLTSMRRLRSAVRSFIGSMSTGNFMVSTLPRSTNLPN